MGDWKPDLRPTVRGAGSEIYYWVIPAQVSGLWKVQVSSARGNQDYELDIMQKHQEINVLARRAGHQTLVISSRWRANSTISSSWTRKIPLTRRSKAE